MHFFQIGISFLFLFCFVHIWHCNESTQFSNLSNFNVLSQPLPLVDIAKVIFAPPSKAKQKTKLTVAEKQGQQENDSF